MLMDPRKSANSTGGCWSLRSKHRLCRSAGTCVLDFCPIDCFASSSIKRAYRCVLVPQCGIYGSSVEIWLSLAGFLFVRINGKLAAPQGPNKTQGGTMNRTAFARGLVVPLALAALAAFA